MATMSRSMTRHTPGTAGMIQMQTERQPFPVIDAVVNDETVGSLKGNKFEPIQLAKVEKLLADPHSVSKGIPKQPKICDGSPNLIVSIHLICWLCSLPHTIIISGLC